MNSQKRKKMSVYYIASQHTDKIYVGSTRKTLEERLSRHRRDYDRWKNNNKCNYFSSFELFELGDVME
ncbi:MAG: GIY-YIG nuclease family protein [Candidatus Paceibacterota bacterium]